MIYPKIRLVFDRKKNATKTEKGLVQIEVSFQGKRKWIGAGVKLYSNEWSPVYHVVKCMEAAQLNKRLSAQVAQIEDFIAELTKKGEPFSFEKLTAFLNKPANASSFLQFIAERIASRGDLRTGTIRTHTTMLRALENFGRIVYTTDVTPANIIAFDDWLHTHQYKQTTVYGYHKRLKRYINEAIRMGIVKDNPYKMVKIERGRSEGIKYLLKEEVDSIRTLNLDAPHLQKARDLFIFQCYTGLSFSDMAKFNWNDVKSEDGHYIIRDVRTKTEENYLIVLLKPALQVLQRYNFVLPVLSNQRYNDYIKAVAAMAGIAKPVSSHWARHTYAVMALSMGVSMTHVSRMLGHSSTKITESTYAKVLARDLIAEYDRLNSLL